MKRIALAFFLLLGLSCASNAQCDGVFASGSFCGNSGASADLVGEATPKAMFNRAFGTVNNGVLITDGSALPSFSTTLPNAVQLNITSVGTLGAGAVPVARITGQLPIANGGTAQSTAPLARASTGLNIDAITTHGDSIYTILSTDRVAATSAAFTASRTWTLPAANSVNAGQLLVVADLAGGVTVTNTLVIARAGADTINGGTSVTINAANNAFYLISDGSSKWTAQAQSAIPGTGTVTNVATGGIITGGPITTTGTLNVNASLTPQGRVTLSTGVPVMQASFSAQTTLYYTPYVGNLIPLYDGTNMVPTAFSEVSIALGSNWAANSNYDMYVGLDSSTLRTCTGAVWTNDTTRAETHTRTSGILLNTSSMTCRYNNTTTFTCGASRCTYVGTVRIGSAGQSNYIFGAVAAGGTAGNFGVWNMYNRVPVRTMVGDSTATWTYNVASTWRAPNGNATMRVSAIRGYDEDGIDANYNAVGNPGAATTMAAGVGLNSTTTPAGSTSPNSAAGNLPLVGSYSGLMGTGYNFISAIEFNTTVTASTWVGNVAAIGVQTGLHVGLSQ